MRAVANRPGFNSPVALGTTASTVNARWSACNAGVPQPSHVLLAMGCSDEQARASLRFSLGHTSTEEDVFALVDAIGPVVERARAAGLTSTRSAD